MSIDSKEVLYSKGKNDECETQEYAVLPILEYLSTDKIVWCPFDKEDSAFVRLIQQNGNKVIYSHIDNGQDFYTYEPPENWDVIISNPPFTNKRKIFERALSFNKPFALIMSNTWLNDAAPVQVFTSAGKQMHLLLFDKRMRFKVNGVIQNKITFSSSYFCCDFLPSDLILKHLDFSSDSTAHQAPQKAA